MYQEKLDTLEFTVKTANIFYLSLSFDCFPQINPSGNKVCAGKC